MALSVLENRLRRLSFDRCLQMGRFPAPWKEANLVLIPKEDRPAEKTLAYRLIYLLDETEKLFTRVVASRLMKHMSSVGPDMEFCQFGFWPGRSTVRAIRRLRFLVERAVSRGRVVLAVSSDISNAFNTLGKNQGRASEEGHFIVPQGR